MISRCVSTGSPASPRISHPSSSAARCGWSPCSSAPSTVGARAVKTGSLVFRGSLNGRPCVLASLGGCYVWAQGSCVTASRGESGSGAPERTPSGRAASPPSLPGRTPACGGPERLFSAGLSACLSSSSPPADASEAPTHTEAETTSRPSETGPPLLSKSLLLLQPIRCLPTSRRCTRRGRTLRCWLPRKGPPVGTRPRAPRSCVPGPST